MTPAQFFGEPREKPGVADAASGFFVAQASDSGEQRTEGRVPTKRDWLSTLRSPPFAFSERLLKKVVKDYPTSEWAKVAAERLGKIEKK